MEITELVDTEAERVDAVEKPANGIPFLLLKAQAGEATEAEAGLIAAERQRARFDAILKKNSPGQLETERIADAGGKDGDAGMVEVENDEANRIIASVCKEAEAVVGQAHELLDLLWEKDQAEYQDFEKGKYSAEDKRKLLSQGKAISNENGDPSYPIADDEDLHNAIRAVGRGGGSHDRIRRYIIKRAKALGHSDWIPDGWSSGGSVSKATAPYMTLPGGTLEDQLEVDGAPYAGPGTSAGVDGAGVPAPTPDQNLAQAAAPAPMDEGGESDTTPGSSVWEAEDAQRLIAAGQCLSQLCNDLCVSMGREQQEVDAGQADDVADVAALNDAIAAVEYACNIVARLAFREETAAQMAKNSLTEESVGVLQEALSYMKGLSDNQPASDGGTIEEEWEMSLTKEDLADAVGGAVQTALEAVFAKQAADAAAAQAELDAKTQAIADAHAPREEAEPVAKSEEEAPEAEAPDMAALVKGALDESLAPLFERVNALEGQPAAGGPLVGAAPAGGGLPAMRGQANMAEPGVTPKIEDLRARVQKAVADGDTIAEQRYRKDLGKELLAMTWETRGYPRSDSRGRAVQFTENAAGR